MCQIILRNIGPGKFDFEKSCCPRLNFLAFFLTNDGYNGKHFIDWLLRDHKLCDFTTRKLTRMIRFDHTVVIDPLIHDKNELITTFSTTKKEMISILSQWIDILNSKPKANQILIEESLEGIFKLSITDK